VTPGTSPGDARRVGTAAGLNARFKKVSCTCIRGVVGTAPIPGTTPGPGAVVDLGATVTINIK